MNSFTRVGLTTIVVSLIVGAGPAWAGKLSGSWRGGGILVSFLGEKEVVRCRVKIIQRSSKSLTLTANCAGTSGKANQTLKLRAVSSNKFSGSFHNKDHNTCGDVVLTVRGKRLRMYMAGNDGTANVTLRR